MAPQLLEDGFFRMPAHEFAAVLAFTAEEGAKRAINDAGLARGEGEVGNGQMRSMLELLRLVHCARCGMRVRLLPTDETLKVYAQINVG